MPNLRTFTQLVNEGKAGSYSMVSGELNPQEGYFISLKGREQKVIPEADNTEVIKAYVMKYGIELDTPGTYLGSWFNGGYLYLDTSIQVFTLSEALKLGKANDQMAIWDAANNVEIYLA